MSDILTLSQIKVPGTARSKDESIREAGEILVEAGAVTPAYVDAMFEREKSISTYMGNYLAIPHGTNESKESIKQSALSVIRYDPPIDWDGNEVRFAVGIAGHEGGHLPILTPSSRVEGVTRVELASNRLYPGKIDSAELIG